MDYKNQKPYNNGHNNNNIVVKPNIKDYDIKSWITCEADETTVDLANKAAEYMGINEVTTSQIRNIYGEIKRIQMNYEAERVAFLLLRPKVAYLVARNKSNKKNHAGLSHFQEIFEEAAIHVTDDKTYNNFCNLMEAIVAYHKVHAKR